MDGEKTFLQERDVTVTSARLVTPAQTFAMSGVVSVAFKADEAQRVGPIILGISGLALGGLTTLGASMSQSSGGAGGVICGLVPLTFAIVWWFTQSDKYSVILRNASGEAKALESPDKAYIVRVVAAVNEAMVSRG